MCNHGFLRDGPGGTLSPAFDINPAPDTAGRMSTAIADPHDRRADIDVLVNAAPYYRIADPHSELARQLEATEMWTTLAERYEVGREIDRLHPAFDHPQGTRAEELLRT